VRKKTPAEKYNDEEEGKSKKKKKKSSKEEGKVRFQEFGSSSLDIMIMYFVDSPRWEDLINVKQDINYKIMEINKRHNSDFAFPTTTVYLQK
jgi:MscS family membrane protein